MSQKPLNFKRVNWSCFFALLILYLVNPLQLHALSPPYLVQDINPTSTSATNLPITEAITLVNGVYFYAHYDEPHGTELWKSDGTAAGTMLVKDIYPGSGSSSPRSLVNLNGTLFFIAIDSASETALWKSDGTKAGTVPVKPINPSSLTVMGGFLYFFLSDNQNGIALWRSDGTDIGTHWEVHSFIPSTK